MHSISSALSTTLGARACLLNVHYKYYYVLNLHKKAALARKKNLSD